jgi:hypothetical protein
MLPTVPIPDTFHRRPLTQIEAEALQRAVGHAVGLYRSVLEGLGVDPFAGLPGHDATAAVKPNGQPSPICCPHGAGLEQNVPQRRLQLGSGNKGSQP